MCVSISESRGFCFQAAENPYDEQPMMLFPSRNRETFGVKPNIDGFDVIFEPKFPSRNQEASLSKQTMYDLFQGYHEFPSRNREVFRFKFADGYNPNYTQLFPSRN